LVSTDLTKIFSNQVGNIQFLSKQNEGKIQAIDGIVKYYVWENKLLAEKVKANFVLNIVSRSDIQRLKEKS
jgi:hypothetical protein